MSKRELSQDREGPAKKKAKTNPAEGTTSNQVTLRTLKFAGTKFSEISDLSDFR